MKYFSYDRNGDGFVLHGTEIEAREAANAALEEERNAAIHDSCWSDEVSEICWGEIRQHIFEVKSPDGTDYNLVDI